MKTLPITGFEALATPYEGAFYDIARTLAWQHFRYIVRYATQLCYAYRTGFTPILEEIYQRLDLAPKDTVYFSPESGLALRALMTSPRSSELCEWLSVQIIVAALLYEVLPLLELRTSTQQPLVAAGFHARGASLTINGNSSHLTFANEAGRLVLGLHKVTRPGVGPVWVDTGGRSTNVAMGSAAMALVSSRHDAWFTDAPYELHEQGEVTGEFRCQLEAAFAVLESDLPDFYIWTAAVLKHACPINRKTESGVCSGSNSFLPGVVQVTTPAPISESAEMLVHECSHQYFNLITRFVPLMTENARSHFSPLTGSMRRIDRILIGYHAFANIALLYARLIELGHALTSNARAGMVKGFLAELERTLDNHCRDELSGVGQTIYRAIHARLRLSDPSLREVLP